MNRRIENCQIRFCYLLLKEFTLPILCMVLIIFGGGYLLHIANPEDLSDYTDGMFAAFAALFFEILEDPPYRWYEQIVFYMAPVIGIFIIADSIVIIFAMLSRKRQKLQQWWIMKAMSYENHIVVCGVGKLGYRVIRALRKMGFLVVGVELQTQMFVEELMEEDVPIILGNVRLKQVLQRANVGKARAVLCVTEDDLTNLDCAFTVREINPQVRVVLRMFDDTVANKIATEFHLPVISTSYAMAPTFIAQALGLETSKQLNICGHAAHIDTLVVDANIGEKTISQLEQEMHVKILAYKGQDGEEVLPVGNRPLRVGDTLTVLRLLDIARATV